MNAKYVLGIGLVIAAVVGCATRMGGADLVDVSIYRGVDASKAGRATLSPSQFRFNPDLSTFATAASGPGARSCNYRFTATGVPNPPVPGASGAVQGLPGYVATFDNNPAGHWGILAPAATPASAAASDVAGYAQAHRENVVNGALTTCN